MFAHSIQSNTIEERFISAAIRLTFIFYVLGALYLVAPVLGWILVIMLLAQWTRMSEQYQIFPGVTVWIWILSILGILAVLVIGHIDFGLGLGQIIKSSIGWAKGWALMPVFILIGYCMNIRLQTVCRAACYVGLYALLITPLLFLAYKLGLPQTIYVSPLKILGGSGPEFFTVMLYEIDPGSGTPRWRYFAPWAPAVGFVANIYFLCCLFERNLRWKIIGLTGNFLMIVLAFSRLGLITLLLIPCAIWVLSSVVRPKMLLTGSVMVLLAAIFSEQIIEVINQILTAIKAARPDSTRVRATLGNIALHQWLSEAYWFGHGIVERGTHLVKFMPIGSHHTWFGLLYVKGVVGLICFVLPFFLTVIMLLIKAQFERPAKLALGVCLILLLFSFGENLEALAYLTWPAWLLIGMGLKPQKNKNWRCVGD